MLREYTTLPSLCLPFLFSFAPPSDYFVLLDEEISVLFRANLQGGLSQITTRYAEVDVSRIKAHLYGDDGFVCKEIQCLDANLLYKGCLGKEMFTGPYIVRSRENHFRPSIVNRGTFTIQFLEFLSRKNSEPIQHALSPGGEFTTFINGRLFHADGFVRSSETRSSPLWLEINTCATHGCPRCFPNRNELNTMLGKTYREIFQQSCERLAAVKCRYQTSVYWECDLSKLYKDDPEFNYFCKHLSMCGPRISSKRMHEHEILDSIFSGELFGAVLCSVKVPDELKPAFDQFPPIICRKTVSTETSGPVMKRIALEMGQGTIARTQLVSCFEAKNILLSTSMLEWFLDHGIIVYDIQKVVQFTRKAPFSEFTETIAQMRKDADSQNDALLSTTAKGLGNSSYGFTLYSAASGVDTKFVSGSKAVNYVRSNRFMSMEELSENVVEVCLERRKVVESLPLHIGFQVYSLSKVFMQHFVHDILGEHLDQRKWEMLATDTDSVCIALAERTVDECVKESAREKWKKVKPSYFIDNSSPRAYEQTARKPLLFKEEIASADVFLAPSAKCYFAGKKDKHGNFCSVKTSAKGINKKQNRLTEKMYREAIFGCQGKKWGVIQVP